MPRDSNGLYVLPDLNPVADGDIIEAEWANTTMSDMAVQMNNIITRDGLLGFTDQLLLINGSSLVPAVSFITQPNLGLFRDGLNALSVAASGVIPIKFTNVAVDTFVPLGIPNGTVTNPYFRFSSDTDTGIFQNAPDELSITAGGIEAIRFRKDGIGLSGDITSDGAMHVTDVLYINQDTDVWSGIVAQVKGANRWMIRFSDDEGEAADNAGSDFVILRSDNAGLPLIPPLAINRASGKINLLDTQLGALEVEDVSIFKELATFNKGLKSVIDSSIHALHIGGGVDGISSAYLYKAGDDTFNIRVGDSDQAIFGFYGFTTTTFTAPGKIVIGGADSNGSITGSQALSINGSYGGGIILNESTHYSSMWTDNGDFRLRAFKAGVAEYTYKFDANGDFFGKSVHGYVDATNWARIGHHEGTTGLQMVYNGRNSAVKQDAFGSLCFLINGVNFGYFDGNGGRLTLSQPGGFFWVPKTQAGWMLTDGSGNIHITFTSPYTDPIVTCTLQRAAIEHAVVVIFERAATYFKARVSFLNGVIVGAGWHVNWMAIEKTQ